jgi:hypothetical protein
MANTGNGENESSKVKPSTEEGSKTSQKTEKPSTRKTSKPITREEASELLTSALWYCQQAGLSIAGLNQGNILRLSIEGLNYDGSKISPVLVKGSNDNLKSQSNVNVTRGQENNV